jgi:tetratricopeptide (TPR) repeat protein
MIRQVVGKPKDWAVQFNPITGLPIDPLAENAAEGLSQENNQLGFYPPAQALVVKASSTIHSRPSNLIITGQGMGAMGALDRDRKDQFALGGANDRDKNKVRVGAGGDKRGDPKKDTGPPPDPKKIWQDALARGVNNPGLIIATADYLALNGKFEHAAEFLKADLRQGLLVEPWVYKALAVALRESGGTTEEIERAELSATDMEPADHEGYLQAARALAQDKRYDRALAFCRQAAQLQPNIPYAYADALTYAELAQDAKAMEWAAGNLLRQDWPVNNKDLQARALQKLEALATALSSDRKDEAQRLLDTMQRQRRRDLVIQLLWQGSADLDLHVQEPSGSTCWTLNRQTIGGGTLIGDSVADLTSETYMAAEAFPGEYLITVERVWGKPLGDKAQLKIIRHQGTPQQHEQLVTVLLTSNKSQPIKIKLDNGRRTETAYVPPPSAQQPPEEPAAATNSTSQVLTQLRDLADPDIRGFETPTVRGSTYSAGRPRQPSDTSKAPAPSPNDRTMYQTKVSPIFTNTADVTAQAVITADRRYVRLSLNVSATMLTNVITIPRFNVVIPGGIPPGGLPPLP